MNKKISIGDIFLGKLKPNPPHKLLDCVVGCEIEVTAWPEDGATFKSMEGGFGFTGEWRYKTYLPSPWPMITLKAEHFEYLTPLSIELEVSPGCIPSYVMVGIRNHVVEIRAREAIDKIKAAQIECAKSREERMKKDLGKYFRPETDGWQRAIEVANLNPGETLPPARKVV
jgi:hypothetical protein